MPEKHTFEFTFPDDNRLDPAKQEQLLAGIHELAARFGASATRASVEELPHEYDLGIDMFTPSIQQGLDYNMQKDPRVTQRVLNVLGGYGCFLTCRDVLVSGKNLFSDIRGFGAGGFNIMQAILDDKVPELPFLEAPDPSFVALFCKNIGQVHFGATGHWNTGKPYLRATIGSVLANAGNFSREVVIDARNYARAFRQARKELLARQEDTDA